MVLGGGGIRNILELVLAPDEQPYLTTTLRNIECFVESLREGIMPLKGRNTIDDYIKVWRKCNDIIDYNEVYTMLIAGLGEAVSILL
jgi:hypothetical protein